MSSHVAQKGMGMTRKDAHGANFWDQLMDFCEQLRDR
jgi:hypothetical protein